MLRAMDKKQEISVLQSLKGDTYFAQFFGGLDIDLMCQNIQNDYPIELGCQFNKKAELKEQEMHEQQLKNIERIDNLVRAMIDSCQGDMNDQMYETLVNEVGKLFIIKYKRHQGYPLTDKEIDYMIAFMDNKIGD